MASTPFSPAPGGTPKVIKVLVVGGPEAGKTSLLQCYNGSDFDEMYTPTLKSDLIVKELKIGTADVSAQMWDIGGSSPMGKSFLRGTQAVLLVADLTSCGSMDGLDAIYERVRVLAGFADDSFPCALVGNKLDMAEGEHEHNREVTMDELRLWAKARRPHNPDSISFYEASAKTGSNVQEMFENLVCLAFTQPAKHLATPAASLVGPGSHYAGSEIGSTASKTPMSAVAKQQQQAAALLMSTGSAVGSAVSRGGAGIREKHSMSPLVTGGNLLASSGAGAGAGAGAGTDELPTAKVIIAGSPRVGKTCILRRFVGDDVISTLETYEPTVGADFRITHVPINDDRTITLQLWDSAGDEKTMSIGRSLYKNADCLVLVYDITSRESFESLKLYWSSYIMYGRPFEPDEFPCLLVGNKCDLGDRRAVPMEEILDWCTYQRPSRPITYMECSALRNINIKDIFVFVGDAIYDYTLKVDSGTDDETEDTGSVYTTETGGTETGNEGDGGGSGRFSARRSHSNDGRRRINGVAQTPTGYRGEGGANGQGPEQGCWVFNCIGLS